MNNLQISMFNGNYMPHSRILPPSCRGAKISVQQPDTFENNKQASNNFGLKLLIIGLGIGAAILAYVKFHKTSSVKQKEELSAELKEIQRIYKEIFKRDINSEEVKDFAQRYKKIIDFKTDNNDREYCDKLLEELCKDRQTQKPEILHWIKDRADATPETVNGMMSTSPDGTYLDIFAFNYRGEKNPAKAYFESLFHETHHVKQDEMIFRTDKEFFLQHILNKFVLNGEGKMYKEMLRANHGNKEKAIREAKEKILEKVNRHWASFAPFEKNSAEYQEGLRLIEGKKNYKFFGNCRTQEEYANQTIEKGAYVDGEKAERLFDLLKNISL